MQKRYKMRQKTSRRVFRHTADRTHRFNLGDKPGLRRGGIRL